jgi:hypothetical protein
VHEVAEAVHGIDQRKIGPGAAQLAGLGQRTLADVRRAFDVHAHGPARRPPSSQPGQPCHPTNRHPTHRVKKHHVCHGITTTGSARRGHAAPRVESGFRYGENVLAAYASSINPADPLAGLEVAETAEPTVPEGWELVTVRAAALNHHDLWSLKGQGLSADLLPMVLGCDAAGVTADGTEVVVHAVIGDPAAGGGDETFDPKRTLLSEKHPGAMAELVAVPSRKEQPV